MHRIKGDPAALGLHQFEFSAHDFEAEIERVKSGRENYGQRTIATNYSAENNVWRPRRYENFGR